MFLHIGTVSVYCDGANGVSKKLFNTGGYEDDRDEGEWLLYTGAGGRDLRGTSERARCKAPTRSLRGPTRPCSRAAPTGCRCECCAPTRRSARVMPRKRTMPLRASAMMASTGSLQLGALLGSRVRIPVWQLNSCSPDAAMVLVCSSTIAARLRWHTWRITETPC